MSTGLQSPSYRPHAATPDALLSLDAFEFLWLEITPRCNLRCTHCYADSGPDRPLHDRMQRRDCMDTLSQAAALGCRSVQFIGGEPTMHPDLDALIEHADAEGFQRIEVFTNGVAITDRLKDVFVRYRVRLAFSVYAARPATHDAITLQPGSLVRTMGTIRWAIGAGLGVRAAIVAMDSNADQVDETREMLREAGVTEIRADGLRGVGRGRVAIAPESQFKELCGACGRDQLCVSADGRVYPCVFSRFCPVGDAADGLDAVMRSTELEAFRRTLRSSRPELRLRHRPVRAGLAADDDNCSPEEPAGTCPPEDPAGNCPPEEPAGNCPPEEPAGDCGPEKPYICDPEHTA